MGVHYMYVFCLDRHNRRNGCVQPYTLLDILEPKVADRYVIEQR